MKIRIFQTEGLPCERAFTHDSERKTITMTKQKYCMLEIDLIRGK